MSEREQVIQAYKANLAGRWKKGSLSLSDVQALKVFIEVHELSVEEHEAAVQEVGIPARHLVDENNRTLADWIRVRRGRQPYTGGGLRFQPSNPATVVRNPSAPQPWQNSLAIAAGVLAVAAGLALIFVR